jgi:hypothetical protein
MRIGRTALGLGASLFASAARAAEVDGASLGAWWGLPFAGMLLSIALMPLLAPKFWHHHFGKVAAGWALAFMLPFAARTARARRGRRWCTPCWPSTCRSSCC